MKEQEKSYSNDKPICPICGGTGFEIIYEDHPDYPQKIPFAKRCPNCAKRFRESDNTGIPLQYAGADLQSFDFSAYGKDMSDFKKMIFSFYDEFRKWQGNGMGLYFCSETPGSGKTLLACSVARSISLKYDIRLRFVTSADYLSLVGESYHRDSGEADASETYRECELLILDDLGAEKEGQWQGQELFRLINSRIKDGKITIYTSNFPQDKLKLDARLVDRIMSSTLPLALPEISIRRKQAEEKQRNIMQQILG